MLQQIPTNPFIFQLCSILHHQTQRVLQRNVFDWYSRPQICGGVGLFGFLPIIQLIRVTSPHITFFRARLVYVATEVSVLRTPEGLKQSKRLSYYAHIIPLLDYKLD